jgi:transposase-like protein
MTQYNFTLSAEAVKEIFIGERDKIFAQILEQILNQLLQAKAEEQCGAAPYEQTAYRKDYRNGVRTRSLVTRVGKIALAVPRLRNQQFSQEIFERYSRSEQALIAGVAEMVINGVSTRKISEVAETLFGESISKSTVSRMCTTLDPIVNEFRQRPLDNYYPLMIVDAIYIKVRGDGKVSSKALYVALGVNTDGYREVLGFLLADTESKSQYKAFFNHLKERGLGNIDLIVSDSHIGLREAIKETFTGTVWQRCQTHFSRNIKDATPKKAWLEVHETLTDIYNAPTLEAARDRKNAAMEKFAKIAPKAMAILDEGFDDITAVFTLPLGCRQKARTSNCIERMNEELRRRERALRIFPNEASVYRILGTVMLEMQQRWNLGNRYIDMTEHYQQIAKHKTKERRRESKNVEVA